MEQLESSVLKRFERVRHNAARLSALGLGNGYGEDSGFEIVESSSSYGLCYPSSGSLALHGISAEGGGVDLKIKIGRRDGGTTAIEYQTGKQPLQRVDDGMIFICFDRDWPENKTESETREIRIREPGSDSWNRLQLTYFPAAHYAAAGRVQHGHDRVHVSYSELPLPGSAVEDWLLSRPDENERKYAQAQWGHWVAREKSPWEKIRRLGIRLIQELEPHRGSPSDVMDTLTPFAMHARLLRGEDHCWSANIAYIYACAATALDLPARCVIMRNQLFPPPLAGEAGMEVLLAGGHTICEFFDRATDQWYWIDLTFRCVGAFLGEVGPLNLWELHHFLNEPRHRPHLAFDCVDPKTGEVSRKSFNLSGLEPKLMNSLKRNQRLVYLRRAATPSKPSL